MRGRFAFVALSLFLGVQLSGAQEEKEPFFQKLEGKWTGSGALVNQDGEETKIEEKWTGEFTKGKGFLMKGTRQWGEDNQEFQWEFSYNPTTELYECLYHHTGMDEPIRFEVSLAQSQVEMRAPLGDPGSELLIRNELSEEGIDGTVRLTGSDGSVHIDGTVTHKKENS